MDRPVAPNRLLEAGNRETTSERSRHARRNTIPAGRLALGALALPPGTSRRLEQHAGYAPEFHAHSATQSRSRQRQRTKRLAELAPFPLAAAPAFRTMFQNDLNEV